MAGKLRARLLASTLLIGGYLGIAVSAAAQDVTPPTGFNEIIVTAQKREESLKDVPISMTAYGSEQLEKLRVTRVEDVLKITPGVDYDETSVLQGQVHIRGINTAVGGLYQTVAVTIDDAPLITTYNGFILSSRLFDVERIEVLRGPQGTLTGSNSTSGSINMITKKPVMDAFFGDVMLDYSRFNTLLARSSVNIPLTDKLAVRAVAFVDHSDGAFKNVGPAGGDSGYDNFGVRLAARLQPTERLTIDAAFNYEKQQHGITNAISKWYSGYDDPAVANEYWAQSLSRNFEFLRRAGGSLSDSPFIDQYGLDGANVRLDLPERTDIRIWSAQLRANYDFGNHKFDAFYTHIDYLGEELSDADRSEWALFRFEDVWKPISNYGEVRITSDYDGSINWVAGASYMRERRVRRSSYIGGDDYFFFDELFGGNPDFSGPYTSPLPEVGGSYWPEEWEASMEGLESKALFANLFLDITDRIHLSAGVRGTFNKSFTAYGGQGGEDRNFTPDFSDTLYGKTSEIDPRVAINFDLNDNVTTYVQFATGHRSGYGNVEYKRAQAAGVTIPEVAKGEKLKNYEVGIKGFLFDKRVSFGLSAYYMDYSNMQVRLETEPVLIDGLLERIGYDTNAVSSSVKGFEFEASAYVTPSLVVSGGISYVESKIDELDVDGEIVRNQPFPLIRPWNAVASAEYTHDLGNFAQGMAASFRVDYSYHDATDSFPWYERGPTGVLPSHHLVDLSIGLAKEGSWRAQAYFENVFNEAHWTSADHEYGVYGTKIYVVPRSFGVRFTKQFGG